MRLVRLLLTASVCLAQLGAQGEVHAPLMGSVYDASGRGIRPIYGIPGAAVLGRAWDGVPRLENAAIAPGQGIALGVGQGQLQLIRLENGGARTTAIAGARGGIERIVFSPGGDTAALLGNGIQVLTGMTDSPQLRDVAAPGGDSRWATAAISDDGKLLLSSGGDAASPVWLIDGSAMQLPLPGSIAAAAFRAGSGDAAVVTRSGDVYRIRNAGASAEVWLVYAGDERTANPAAIYFSANGSRILTASRSGMLAAISAADGSAAAVSCNCAPSTLAPMAGATLFRITENSDGPIWLFDPGVTPRVWFVPRAAGFDRRKR